MWLLSNGLFRERFDSESVCSLSGGRTAEEEGKYILHTAVLKHHELNMQGILGDRRPVAWVWRLMTDSDCKFKM